MMRFAKPLQWLGLFICSYSAAACGARSPLDDSPIAELSTDAAATADGSGGTDGEASEGDADAESYSGACLISASNYDQTCTADSDCAVVTSGDYCSTICLCGGSVINAVALTQFNKDVSETPVGTHGVVTGYCPCTPPQVPCCRHGKCAASGCSGPSDTLPSCVDAGGECVLTLGLGSCRTGPPNSCVYADESCCL
jgi:hypothetical protein